MTTRTGNVAKAHRLLAPRIAYLIGTRSPEGEANLIPVSNVTSISNNPQLLLLAVYKDWKTYRNLNAAAGFTLSVPSADHREGVWKLGARYSCYDFRDRETKLRESGLALTDEPSLFGPVLSDGLGWLSCRITQRPDYGGDHGMFVGEVVHVEFDDDVFAADATPLGDLHPLMQVTGNLFTTASATSRISYGE